MYVTLSLDNINDGGKMNILITVGRDNIILNLALKLSQGHKVYLTSHTEK